MKTNKFTTVLFAIISLSIQAQSTYFVDATNGNDSNNGNTETSAWQSIQKVESMSTSFQAGDQILFNKGEVWNGYPLNPSNHSSGTINNPIIYSSYGSGAKPIINIQTEQNPTWTYEGNNIWTVIIPTGSRFFKGGYEMLRAVDLSYLGLYGTEYYTELVNNGNNFKLYYYSTTNPSNDTFYWSPYLYVLKLNNADYIEISDIDFRGGANGSIRVENNNGWKIIDCNIGRNAGQGLVISYSDGLVVDSCQFDANNTIDQSQLPDSIPGSSFSGCGDGILIRTGSSNITISNCFFKNWGHASFGANTDDSSNIISNIKFHNNELTSPDILYGGRMGYSGYVEDSEFYNNYIHDISVQSQLGGSRNHFHHNIIDGVLDSPLKSDPIGVGIMLQNYNVQVKDNIIENNVIANTDSEGIVIYSINFQPTGEVSGNIIRNNIIYNCGSETNNVGIQFHKDQPNQFIYNNIVENNLIYNDNTVQTCRYQYNGTVYDATTFNTQEPDIQDNIGNDPLFVSAVNGDFHLTLNSPALDAGTIPLSTLDYDGNSIPNGLAADIGAFEYYEPLGIASNQIDIIAIYPNPTLGKIFLPKQFNNEAYKIYSLKGTVVKSGTVREKSVDLSKLETGIYLIIITEMKTGNNKTATIVKK